MTGQIRYANTVCEEILGYRQADLVGQFVLDLVVADDRAKTLREAGRVLAGHKRVGFENRYRHRSGADVHLSWSAQWHPAHQLRIGVARDVTALRQGPATESTKLSVTLPRDGASTVRAMESPKDIVPEYLIGIGGGGSAGAAGVSVCTGACPSPPPQPARAAPTASAPIRCFHFSMTNPFFPLSVCRVAARRGGRLAAGANGSKDPGGLTSC